jgi:DNA-binding NtrC family response regulator
VVYTKGETNGEELLEIDVPECSKGMWFRTAKVKVVEESERRYIETALRESRGNISKAARIVQMNRRAFWRAIANYGIKAERYRKTRTS